MLLAALHFHSGELREGEREKKGEKGEENLSPIMHSSR